MEVLFVALIHVVSFIFMAHALLHVKEEGKFIPIVWWKFFVSLIIYVFGLRVALMTGYTRGIDQKEEYRNVIRECIIDNPQLKKGALKRLGL